MTDDANPPKTPVDWAAIQAEWRIGVLSNYALAEKYGISETRIRQRAKKEKWVRDISEEVRKRAKQLKVERIAKEAGDAKIDGIRAKMREALENGGIPEEGSPSPSLTAPHTDPIVEAAAEVKIQIVAEHCARAKRYREIADLYIALLNKYLKGSPEEKAEAAKTLFGGRQGDNLQAAMKVAVDAVEKVQKIERQNYDIEGDPRKIEISGPNGGPIQKELDLSSLTVEELIALENLAEKLSTKG